MNTYPHKVCRSRRALSLSVSLTLSWAEKILALSKSNPPPNPNPTHNDLSAARVHSACTLLATTTTTEGEDTVGVSE